MTSLRRHHRELAALHFAAGSIDVAGTAEAAVMTPTHIDGVAGIGFQSVP